jgi:hypothetical protein
MKAVRLLLAVSVSVWMTGGCLFSCSNSAMGAENSVQTAVAGDSCHTKQSHGQSHDCCAAKKRKKQIARTSKQPSTLPTLAPAPRGMVNDCPLVVNSTAVISKKSGHSTDPARGPVVVSPSIEKTGERPNTFVLNSSPPNRGPTYLRCCVFLI